MNEHYITTIGLEVHLQISTRTKAFCSCPNEFGKEPNSLVCPVCMGFPGSLPVLNEQFLRYAIKVAVALNCNIAHVMKFDRKNYFYPDLPKNFQTSQYDRPLALGGGIEIICDDKSKTIGITRVHMEEDAGKLVHSESGSYSLIDYNRSAAPLLEIVSEPDIESPDEAHAYLTALKAILEYLEVSTCDMEKGSLRCDANISLRPKGQKELGEKVEIKNMNSFRHVRLALEFEQTRQAKALSSGKKIIQETRLWDADKKVTEPMRTKEEAHDYRYFPEPDLPLFSISRETVDDISKTIPMLPKQRSAEFVSRYSISQYDASVIVSDKAMADYFEECVKIYPKPKAVINWITGEILKYLNENNLRFGDLKIRPLSLADMLKLIDEQVISSRMAKDVLNDMFITGRSASDIVKEKGLVQLTDDKIIDKLAQEVIDENSPVVNDYLSGKDKAFGFLVGQLMKKTSGKINPQMANQALKKRLSR